VGERGDFMYPPERQVVEKENRFFSAEVWKVESCVHAHVTELACEEYRVGYHFNEGGPTLHTVGKAIEKLIEKHPN
jgi:hypothetical protein